MYHLPGTCHKCGGEIIGDGYTSTMHCENAHEEDYQYNECDADVTLCRMEEEPDYYPDTHHILGMDYASLELRVAAIAAGRRVGKNVLVVGNPATDLLGAAFYNAMIDDKVIAVKGPEKMHFEKFTGYKKKRKKGRS